VQGRPAVSYDDQGLVFALAYGGHIRMFDARKFEKVVLIECIVQHLVCNLSYLTHICRVLLRSSQSEMTIQKPMS
jgi:hypothetical protein